MASRAWALGEKNPRFLGSVAIDLALVAALLDDGAQARRAFAYVNWEHLEGYTKLWAEAEGAAIEGLFDEAQAKARAGIAALERPRLARPSGRERERLQWLAGRGDVRA